MVKRKFYASMLMLIVAATTLVTGTYAWFLVGGFGSLFDLGFDVIEAGGGVLLRGSAQPAQEDSWKNKLERVDFVENSFLREADEANGIAGGRYTPISSADPTKFDSFVKVSLNETDYESVRLVETDKGQYYNDFTVYIKSTGAVGNARMKILFGEKAEGAEERVIQAACNAARVSVTYDGTTRIYAIEGQTATSAVTNEFALGDVVEGTPEDRIITSSDSGSSAAGLTAQNFIEIDKNGLVVTASDADAGKGILLENIPESTDMAGKPIEIRVWLEGNDADCVDFADATIAGDKISVGISFSADQ